MRKFVPPADMVNHPLWQGSLLQTALRMNALTDDMIQDKARRMGRLDDATTDELSFRAILQRESDKIEADWAFD